MFKTAPSTYNNIGIADQITDGDYRGAVSFEQQPDSYGFGYPYGFTLGWGYDG